MRRLDHRSWPGRGRTRRRTRWRGRAGRDCRSCQELHRQISATAFGKMINHPRLGALVAFLALALFARAQFSTQLSEASKPLSQGVPEVAAVRLQELSKQNLSESDWRATAEKLLAAMVAANETKGAFNLLADPRLRQSLSANFWRAQLLAGSHREAEALPLYQQIAADSNSSF